MYQDKKYYNIQVILCFKREQMMKIYLFLLKWLQVQKLGECHEIIFLLPIKEYMYSRLSEAL